MTAREPSMLHAGGAALPPAATEPQPAPRPASRPGTPRPRDVAGEGPLVWVAGFWRRLAAALVDTVVILPVAWLLVALASKLAGINLPDANRTGVDYWLDLALAGEPALWGGISLAATIVVVYLLLFQIMAGRTLGMRLLGLRIIDVYGDPPGVLRGVVRTAGYLACFATLSLGFLWIGFDREKRGLHDWLAGTYVVRDKPARKP